MDRGCTEESGGATATTVVEGGDSWEYIRCPCLGLLPGLICPHHDRVQSNGVLRATDFDGQIASDAVVACDLVVDSDRLLVVVDCCGRYDDSNDAETPW